MGTFLHTITIMGPEGEATVEALVEPSRLFAVIPSDILERLGVNPLSERTTREGRLLAQPQARLGGVAGWVMCEIAGPGEQPLIGRHTLDSFILDIDGDGNLIPKVLHEVRHF